MPKLGVMKGEALDYPVYQGFAALKDLAAISFVDRALMDKPGGVQRELNRAHAREFRRFIDKPGILHVEKASAPPLIFSLRVKTRYHAVGDVFGTLTIPDNKRALAQLDAQHRMAETADVEKSLPFILYYDLEPDEEVALFTIINDKHMGLTKSLVDKNRARLIGDDLPEEEPHLWIALKLNSEKKSPWYHGVDTGGEKTPGTKRRVTLRTFQEATKEMISGPRCQNADRKTKYEVVQNFWKGIVTVFPKEWAKPRNYLITKGIGVHALSAVGRDLIETRLDADDYTPEAFAKALQKLEGFDWGNKTSVFSVVSGKKGVKFATILLNRVIFGGVPVTKVKEEAQKIKV